MERLRQRPRAGLRDAEVAGGEEAQHEGIARRRTDAESLFAYLAEQRIPAAVNHLFSALTGRRATADFHRALSGLERRGRRLETPSRARRPPVTALSAGRASFEGMSFTTILFDELMSELGELASLRDEAFHRPDIARSAAMTEALEALAEVVPAVARAALSGGAASEVAAGARRPHPSPAPVRTHRRAAGGRPARGPHGLSPAAGPRGPPPAPS